MNDVSLAKIPEVVEVVRGALCVAAREYQKHLLRKLFWYTLRHPIISTRNLISILKKDQKFGEIDW